MLHDQCTLAHRILFRLPRHHAPYKRVAGIGRAQARIARAQQRGWRFDRAWLRVEWMDVDTFGHRAIMPFFALKGIPCMWYMIHGHDNPGALDRKSTRLNSSH